MTTEGTGTPVVDLVLADIEMLRYERFGARQDIAYRDVVAALLHLGLDGEAISALLRVRDAAGLATYGTRLCHDTRKPDGSRYDWRQEAAEELADALLYLRAAIEEEKTR